MNLNQVHALLVVVLLLASVVTALWGAEIAGALGGAWSRGTAQAAAEKRRLEHAAREARDSGAWQQAKAAGRGMHGAAKGAGAWARKENGPVRRILAAAATGGYIGAKGAARAAAGAAKHRKAAAEKRRADAAARGARDSGTWSRARAAARSMGSAARAAAGWRRRPGGSPRPRAGTGSRFRARRHLRVCDGCGHIVALASLVAGLCFMCRRKQSPQASPPEDPAGEDGTVARDTAALTPPPAVPLPSGGDGASAGTVPGVQPGPQLPAPAQGTSGQVPAAAGTPAAIQSAPTGGVPVTAGAIGSGRPGSAVALADRPGGALAARPPGGVARGDAADHGEWVENAKAVIKYVSDMFAFVRAMTEGMKAGECPAESMDETAAWAEMIYAYGTRILTELVQVNKDIEPWIKTIMAHGGWQNVAAPRWLQGR